MKMRCTWAMGNALSEKYHDEEWGVPSFDDRHLFELLILEGAQAGLSWNTILKRREGYRKAFDQFDPKKVAKFDQKRIEEILKTGDVIRHRGKIESAVTNAQCFLNIQQEFGSFSRYLWSFVKEKPIINHWKTLSEVPTSSKESIILSKDLKKRGLKFVGHTIMYAYMQAVGLVNDHLTDCFCTKYGSKGSQFLSEVKIFE